MAIRIGINGLGRIGRCVLRAIYEHHRTDVQVVAINGTSDAATHAHLLKYDSLHGTYRGQITVGKSGEGDDAFETLDMGQGAFRVLKYKKPLEIPWGDLGVDVVLECTGKFTRREDAVMHLEAGAKKVLISAPAENVDATIVHGVNNEMLKPNHTIISVGSCTTNCLAPVAKVLHDLARIESGFMTTIHSYTGDQRLLDGSHKDLRRARAAAMAMIPTSTGAAKAIGLVLPDLAGRLAGTSVRVPTPNVSLVDLVVQLEKSVSVETIHHAMREAAAGPMKGVLDICDEPLVSIDFNHSPYSAIFDTTGTVVNGSMVRVAAWYDNEWGFSCRMVDLAAQFGSMIA